MADAAAAAPKPVLLTNAVKRCLDPWLLKKQEEFIKLSKLHRGLFKATKEKYETEVIPTFVGASDYYGYLREQLVTQPPVEERIFEHGPIRCINPSARGIMSKRLEDCGQSDPPHWRELSLFAEVVRNHLPSCNRNNRPSGSSLKRFGLTAKEFRAQPFIDNVIQAANIKIVPRTPEKPA